MLIVYVTNFIFAPGYFFHNTGMVSCLTTVVDVREFLLQDHPCIPYFILNLLLLQCF